MYKVRKNIIFGIMLCSIAILSPARLIADFLTLFNAYLSMPESVCLVDRDFEQQLVDKKVLALYPQAVIQKSELLEAFRSCIGTFLQRPPYADPKNWLHGDKPIIAEYSPTFPGAYVQRLMIAPGSKIYFFGDLHGSIHAFIRDLIALIKNGVIDRELRLINPNTYIVFLGDLADYGRFGVDVLYLVAQLRIANPERVIICRGNHEDASLNRADRHDYACRASKLFSEIKERYDTKDRQEIIQWISLFYEFLPFAVFAQIEGDQQAGVMQWCHGGVEPKAMPVVQELLASEHLFARLIFPDHFTLTEELIKVDPTIRPHYPPISGFCWADFSGKSGLSVGNRPHWKYGIDKAEEYMYTNNIKLIMRGHQDCFEHCKLLMEGIDDPVALFSLIPKQAALVQELKTKYGPEAWAQMPQSTENLRDAGIKIKDFPRHERGAIIAPIVTVTNASAPKATCSHGTVHLACADCIEESQLKIDSYTNEILRARGQFGLVGEEIFNADWFGSFAQYCSETYKDNFFLPKGCCEHEDGSLWSDESDAEFAQRRAEWAEEAFLYFKAAYVAISYWKLYTIIDQDGVATMGFQEPERIEEVLTETYKPFVYRAYVTLREKYQREWRRIERGYVDSGFAGTLP